MKFDYDAFGQRIAKHIYSIGTTPTWEKSIYYVRDAQGNIMATYEHKNVSGGVSYKVNERPMYGSSRIGVDITPAEFLLIDGVEPPLEGLVPPGSPPPPPPPPPTTQTVTPDALGNKLYELNNHLGNVISVVSGAKFPVGTAGNPILSYNARIVSYNDYLPGGSPMAGRTFNSSKYRYGFNGMEKDAETKGEGNSYTTEFRQYDPRLSRWFTQDPIIHPWQSPYVSMGNNPIVFSDPNGDKITGTREDKRAFKKQQKLDGTWKETKREYRGNKKNLHIVSTDKVDNSMATAEIQSQNIRGNPDVKKVDWLYYNPDVNDAGGAAAESSPDNASMNPMPSQGPATVPRPDIIPPTMRTRPMLELPRDPINFNVNAPFNAGFTTFSNPIAGNNQLQSVANIYLNSPDATQIRINIGTNANNLNQPSSNPDGRPIGQLLWDRGRAMRSALIMMGVPVSAFPNNWLIFSPGTTIGTIISVR